MYKKTEAGSKRVHRAASSFWKDGRLKSTTTRVHITALGLERDIDQNEWDRVRLLLPEYKDQVFQFLSCIGSLERTWALHDIFLEKFSQIGISSPAFVTGTCGEAWAKRLWSWSVLNTSWTVPLIQPSLLHFRQIEFSICRAASFRSGSVRSPGSLMQYFEVRASD